MTLSELLNPWRALAKLSREHAETQSKLNRLTDRDKRGRFTKAETD